MEAGHEDGTRSTVANHFTPQPGICTNHPPRHPRHLMPSPRARGVGAGIGAVCFVVFSQALLCLYIVQ